MRSRSLRREAQFVVMVSLIAAVAGPYKLKSVVDHIHI
jgi:hypothetical protein